MKGMVDRYCVACGHVYDQVPLEDFPGECEVRETISDMRRLLG